MTRTARARFAPFVLLVLGAAASCAQDDDPATPPRATKASTVAPAPRADALRGSVLAREASMLPKLWAADAAAPGAHGFIARGVSAVDAAREQLGRALDLYKATPQALDAARPVRTHDSGRGPIAVVFRQAVDGIDLLHGDVKVLLRRDLEIAAIGGTLRAEARRDRSAPPFILGARDAVARALDHTHGAAPTPADLQSAGTDAGGYERFDLPGATGPIALGRPARARKFLLTRGGELVPVYRVEIVSQQRGAPGVTRGVVVDATSGSILEEGDLTQHETFDYLVWAHPDGTPTMPIADVTPHPTGTPDGSYPDFVAQSLVTQEGFNTNPDGLPDPWLADDATTTRGNNIDAYTDGGQDGFSGGDVRGATTSERAFEHTYDPTVDPLASDTQRMGAVTQLFYTTNWLHDAWYDVGFNEAAGNAQADNLGRGGADGDRLQAQAQDDAPFSLNNANMFTPADGDSPVMQMYLFDGRNGGPYADADLDVDVVAHEWGHYLHHRLVDCESFFAICNAESEGWGDFLSLHTGVREGDDLEATYGMGAYATGAYPNGAYFGIRRFPYTRDLARNGLTFRHIQDSAALPPGPNNDQGYPNSEVHGAGEVWTTMLWQAYSNLLIEATGPDSRYSFAEARRRMAEYVVVGMTMAPSLPDFTEQRDAILLAAQAADPQDWLLLAQGFAARGAGTCAVSPSQESFGNEGVVESFVVGSKAEVASLALFEGDENCDADGHLDRGESGRIDLVVRNSGVMPMIGATVTFSEAADRLVFPDGAELELPDLAPSESIALSVAVEVAPDVDGYTTADLDVRVADAGGCIAVTVQHLGAPLNADEAAAFNDPVEATTSNWGVTGSAIWSIGEGLNGAGAWHGLDRGQDSDGKLFSVAMDVLAGEPFTIAFTHRYQFEASYDGGVVEISTNDGTSWVDVSTYADIDYDQSVGSFNNRPGFTGQNPSYPDADDVLLDLGEQLAGQSVRFRFRAASDFTVGGEGWTVDDITVTGVAEPPFIGYIDDADSCNEGSGGAGGVGGVGGAGGAGGHGNGGHGGESSSGGNGGSGEGGGGGGASSTATTGQGGTGASGSTTASTGPSTVTSTSGAGGGGLGDDIDASGDGCDCRTAPGEGPPATGLAAAFALVGLGLSRRRRARQQG